MKKLMGMMILTVVSVALLSGCGENNDGSVIYLQGNSGNTSAIPVDLKGNQESIVTDTGAYLQVEDQKLMLETQDLEDKIRSLENLTIVIETNQVVNLASQSSGAAKYAFEKLVDLGISPANKPFLEERVDKIQREVDTIAKLRAEATESKDVALNTIESKREEVIAFQKRYEAWKQMMAESKAYNPTLENRAEKAIADAFAKIENSIHDVETVDATMKKYLDETEGYLIKAKSIVFA